MQKKTMSAYDDTKKMLNTLRKLNESKNTYRTLKEQVEKNDITVINDVDIKINSTDPTDLEITEEHKNSISGLIDSFRDQVSRLADLEPGLTINTDQIRLDGTISDLDINFVYIAGEESGLYLNADMLIVDEDVMLTLDKLNKFKQTFKDTFEPIIRERKNN
jgi:hypothetical protein